MSILEEYEKRYGIATLTTEQISRRVELSEACLTSPAVGDPRLHTESIIVWLHDRLQAAYGAIENPAAPVAARCAWCFRAGLQTDETWRALPKMTLDDAAAHSQVCERNPLVQEIRRLTALLDGFVHGEGKP